jgi:prepilin peptidase CpaA
MTNVSTAQVWYPVPPWVWVVLAVASTVACVTDLRNMRIPNLLSLPLLAFGLLYGAWVGGFPGLGQSLGGAAIAGVIFVAAYALAGGGAGDAKLMMALGAWLGVDRSVLLVMCVAVAGVFWAIGITIARGGVRDVPVFLMHNVLSIRYGARRLLRGRAAVAQTIPSAPQPRFKGWYPYAPVILVGTIAAWWYWEQKGPIV